MMEMNSAGRRVLHVMLAVFCVLALAFPVLASSDDRLVIADYEDGRGEWVAGDNVKYTSFADLYEDYDPYSELPPRKCLEVVSMLLDVNLIRSTAANFEKKLDLSEYRTFSYDIYPKRYEADPFAVYYTRLTLYSADGSSKESLISVSGGEWTHVEADISEWDGREQVISAEIALMIVTSVKEFNENSFYIDDVYACNKVDRELTERFLFDLYTVENASVKGSADKSMITLAPSGTGPVSLGASVFLPEFSYEVNSLRLKIANHTDNDTLVIHYTTFDTAVVSEAKSVSVKLDAQSDARYYYADIGDASMLRSLELRFGDKTGKIELHSISVVTAYRPQPKEETCGQITSCTLSDDLLSVGFSGDVLREEALLNQSGVIAIYRMSQDANSDVSPMLLSEPIVTSPMSTRFDLRWTLPKSEPFAAHSLFMAVSLRTDGSFVPISAPFYISNPERAAAASKGIRSGAKGFAASDISLVGDVGTGVTVLDLDIRRAFAAKNGSERYIYNGEAYYFDKAFFNTMTAQITALSGSGVDVLLRITNWDTEFAGMLAISYITDTYIDYSNMTAEPDGTDFLGAFSAYAAGMWFADGRACGVILGKGENLLDGAELSLNAATARTAADLRILYMNLISANAKAKVYVSVSDLYTSDPASGLTELGMLEFIPALIAETSVHGKFPWGICIDRVYRLTETVGAEYVTVNECSDLISLLIANFADQTPLLFIDSTYSFPKTALADEIASFAYGYYCALFNDRIDAYIASVGADTDKIAEIVDLIDTEDYRTVWDLALFTLDAESWKDLIPSWDKKRPPIRSLSSRDAETKAPSGIKGHFRYYTFDAFMGSTELDAGYYCSDIQIVDDGGPVLEATLSADTYGKSTATAWMGVTHMFDYPENFKITPVLQVTLKVDDMQSANSSVPVKLVLMGEEERFESSAEIPVGNWTTLYIYTGDFSEANDTEGLQLLVGGESLNSAKLSIREINGLSREYNNESLESVIAEERLKKRAETDENEYGAYLWIGAAVIITVATVIVVVLLSGRTSTKKKEG